MIDLSMGINIAGFIGVLAFLWKIRGDMSKEVAKVAADLTKEINGVSKRVARIEGLLEGERNAALKASQPQ